MTRRGFYLGLLALCLMGYIWLGGHALGVWEEDSGKEDSFTVCPLKLTTGVPCPSCGTTRSLLLLLKGQVAEALSMNPLGLLALLALLILPLWLAVDLLRGRDSLYRVYRLAEGDLRRPRIAIPSALLILALWLWNIHKGL